MTTTRREFVAAAAAAGPIALGASTVSGRPPEAPTGRPRLAVLTSAYHYLSHAYHIVGRFLDGFVVPGSGEPTHRPHCEIASLFIEQTPDNDLGRDKAKGHGVRLSPTIADALTLGTGKLSVDGVLLIGEHGDYPYNEKLQKLYPRGRFFRDAVRVIAEAGRPVPIFIDKHLSYSRPEALQMVEDARRLEIPLMAGSSLPVTWRLPAFEPAIGTRIRDLIVASRGEIEIFGFHALEALQCIAERRDRSGKPQGVSAVTCLSGDSVWKAGGSGLWSWDLLQRALDRSHTRNPGDARQNTRDFTPPPGRPTFLREPTAFLVEYADGLKAAVLVLNGQVDDTTLAARLDDGSTPATLFYLPAPPGANFFTPLVLRIDDFLTTGRAPYPVERTLLTGGILDAALESRIQGSRRVVTPLLETIDYDPPTDSGFIRTPIAGPGADPARAEP